MIGLAVLYSFLALLSLVVLYIVLYVVVSFIYWLIRKLS